MSQKAVPHSLLDLLSANKKELDTFVLDFLPSSNANREIANLYEMMRDYPSRGGKGFRGSLCLLWCELFGGQRKNAITTASALELFQDWILIHDDVEDDSDLRRGKPTLHKIHGTELAINAGDALHGKMWELLLSNSKCVGERACLQILSEFSTMLEQTTEGQQIELSWNVSNNWEISESDYMLMVTKKSAWYTCTSPARMGVILATKDNDENDTLSRIIDMGTDMGIAFQIIDDILNLTASQDKYGKEILGDIFEGKKTLMILHLLSKSTTEEKKKIISVLSKPRPKKNLDEVNEVFEQMKKAGSLDYARSLASRHAERGLSEYDSICSRNGVKNKETYQTTRLLLEYLVKRDY